MGKPVNILASLSERFRAGGRGSYGRQSFVEVKSDELWIDLDEKKIAEPLAVALGEQARANLLTGKWIDGRPFPALDADTVTRREYRAEQGKRGGRPAGAGVRKNAPLALRAVAKTANSRIARTVRKYNERFRAPKLGKFTPMGGSVPGNESGMTAASFVMVYETALRAFRGYFAGARGLRRDRTGMTAVERLAARVGGGVNAALMMSTPAAQKALEQVAQGIVAKNKAALLKAVMETARSLKALGAELTEEVE